MADQQQPEELKEYEYEIGGGIYTAELSEKDAKRLNAKPVGSGEARAKAAGEDKFKTKVRKTAENKSAE